MLVVDVIVMILLVYLKLFFLNIDIKTLSQTQFGMLILHNSVKLMNINEKDVIRNILNNKLFLLCEVKKIIKINSISFYLSFLIKYFYSIFQKENLNNIPIIFQLLSHMYFSDNIGKINKYFIKVQFIYIIFYHQTSKKYFIIILNKE